MSYFDGALCLDNGQAVSSLKGSSQRVDIANWHFEIVSGGQTCFIEE